MNSTEDLLNHISHPGLSKSIRTLEEELGIKLITRDGRGIKITHEGQLFLLETESFLSAESHLLSSVKQVHQNLNKTVRIGTFEVFSTYLPIPKPELYFLKITEIKMGIFGSRELFSKIKKLEELPFVTPISNVDGTPTKVRGLDGWPDERIPRNIRYSVTLMESALAIVREGFGVAYLPKFIADFHNQTAKEENCHFMAICKVLRGLK